MPNSGLLVALLFTVSLSLTGWLLSFRAEFEPAAKQTGGALARLFGEGRRMFSNHFFMKADAYFHRGNYPSIFEERSHEEEDHKSQGTRSEHHEGETAEEHAAHNREAIQDAGNATADLPRDWIANLNRRLKPSVHVHLEGGSEREMLPWLRLSAELEPHRIETYVVAAYWLRTRLGKVDEAEQFLREGLRENPDSYEILLELGRLYDKNRNDLVHARNVLELASVRWKQREGGKEKPDHLALGQILSALASVEERAGNLPRAIEWMEQLKQISPAREALQRQIDELRARLK